MQSVREDNLGERYAIKLCFEIGKNATETYRILHSAFGASCMNRASVFEWNKRFKEGRESVRDGKTIWRSKEVNLGLGCYVEVLREFMKRFHRKWPALLKSGQWHFQQYNMPVDNSILVTDFFTKMGIKTVPQPPYSPDLAPCEFWLFSKLRGCRYETI